LATGFVRLHQADVPVKVVKIPPAPTAGTAQRIRALQTEEIFDGRCAGDDARAARICSAAEKLDTSSDGSGARARANAFGYTPSTSITYPLSPPEAKPSIKRRWRIKNNTITGKIMNRPAALVSPNLD
jgi:hypothetical protein